MARNHEYTYRPLVAGTAILNPLNGRPGTLGGFATSNGEDWWILSCYHVLARPGGAAFADGEPIMQSTPNRGGQQIARTSVAHSNAALDCAAARVDPGIAASGRILGLPAIAGVSDPVVGMRVIKSGYVTGVTEGVISKVAASNVDIIPHPSYPSEFDLSDYGDSGALWIDAATGNAVALHTAGNDYGAERAFGKVLSAVLLALGLELAI